MTTSRDDEQALIDRREAIRRVSALLGGVAIVGGSALWTGCRAPRGAGSEPFVPFTADEIAFLDEVADTMLPDTAKSPGARAAHVGAFMAVMVADCYDEADQRVFRQGMRRLDDESRARNGGAAFMAATPAQRLSLLEALDREAKTYMDARESARASAAAKAQAQLKDQRQEAAPSANAGAGGATAITADAPTHYFRMMKELALLGYFTSEIGYTKAQRYVEAPGAFVPCADYTPGERAWAPHA